MNTPDKNLSTENQPKGSARNLSDTLDRQNEDVDPGQREWNADSRKKPDDAQNPGAPQDGASGTEAR